jgi:hypothetical protein
MCGVGLRRRLDSAGIVRFEVGQPHHLHDSVARVADPVARALAQPVAHAAERLDERVGGLVRDGK